MRWHVGPLIGVVFSFVRNPFPSVAGFSCSLHCLLLGRTSVLSSSTSLFALASSSWFVIRPGDRNITQVIFVRVLVKHGFNLLRCSRSTPCSRD